MVAQRPRKLYCSVLAMHIGAAIFRMRATVINCTTFKVLIFYLTTQPVSRCLTKQHSDSVLHHTLGVHQPAAHTSAAAVTKTLEQCRLLQHADEDRHGKDDRRLVNITLEKQQQPVEANHTMHIFTKSATCTEHSQCCNNISLHTLLLLLFWNAPLEVCTTICRHHITPF